MPQLDLFGAPIGKQPEEKPAEKLPLRKKGDAKDNSDGNETGLENIMPGGNKLRIRTQAGKKEEEPAPIPAPQILSLFDSSAKNSSAELTTEVEQIEAEPAQ